MGLGEFALVALLVGLVFFLLCISCCVTFVGLLLSK